MIQTSPHTIIRAFATLVLIGQLLAAPIHPAAATPPGQQDFPTAQEAAAALVQAARARDQKAVRAILGAGADKLIASGDAVQDAVARDRFLAAYDARHAIEPRGENRAALVVGANDWPLPIPIVQQNGRWYFDAAAAADELVDRRIGRNELMTIRTLLAGVAAQQDYFARLQAGAGSGAYAQRILSTPGQTDGLFWEVEDGQPPSPLGPLVAQAREEGYPGATAPGGKPTPYHGYLFRILKAQGPSGPGGARDYMRNGVLAGGFAFLAWPAEYGNSGIMSFIVGADGTVYQKDLGPGSARAAAGITRFDPDISWARVDIKD